jgi:hypothetical protein
MVCETCKTTNIEGARFCCNCGGELANPSVSPQEMSTDKAIAVITALTKSRLDEARWLGRNG